MKGPADLVFNEGCGLLVSCFFPSRPFPTHWCRASGLHLFREPMLYLSLTTDFAGDTHILTSTVLFGKGLFAVAKTNVLTRGHLWREDQRTDSRDSGRTPGRAWGGATPERQCWQPDFIFIHQQQGTNIGMPRAVVLNLWDVTYWIFTLQL